VTVHQFIRSIRMYSLIRIATKPLGIDTNIRMIANDANRRSTRQVLFFLKQMPETAEEKALYSFDNEKVCADYARKKRHRAGIKPPEAKKRSE
jgi:hypothetical protein